MFGAGASKHALPIVEEIPVRLNGFMSFLISAETLKLPEDLFPDLPFKETQAQLQNQFFSDIKWVKSGAESHASIDTFAKKLYTTRKFYDLRRLKAVITFFFIFEQVQKNADYRYDSFFAALIHPKDRQNPLPKNLKILSWNYDFQFEKSFSEYSQDLNLKANQITLNIFPADVGNYNCNKFSILKLNGTTSIHETHWRNINNIFSECKMEINMYFMETMIRAHSAIVKLPHQYDPLLKFAWEDDEIAIKTVQYATEGTRDTEVLIVIGYSFPFFNREIDRKLIRGMTNLKKVYFQAPGEEARKYIDRFRSIIPDVEKLKPEPISDVYQFFLPPEL